jgi:hypothetical protein
MLRFNGNRVDRIRPLGGPLLARGFSRVGLTQKLKENFSGFGQFTSMPGGYQSAFRAVIPTLGESGFMAVVFTGVTTTSFTVTGVGNLSVVMVGQGDATWNANVGANMYVTFQGEGFAAWDARAKGNMTVVMDAGARPSAFDIAQEVWQGATTSYNNPGTMGEALNDAAAGGGGGTTAALTPEQEEQLATAARNSNLIPGLF